MICTENTIKNTIYSVGTDRRLNLKEGIADVHGTDTNVVEAANELDLYISSPELKQSSWYWSFFRRVKSGMWYLNPQANDTVRANMAMGFIDELLNGGYIRTLRSLAGESGTKKVSFARGYADSRGVPIGAVLLFGPKGGACIELLHFLAAERVHGQHRPGACSDSQWSEERQERWRDAGRIGKWTNDEVISFGVAEQDGRLPEQIVEALRELWRRNPTLREYTGTKRIPGDIPFQIIEDVVDVIIQRKFLLLDKIDKAKYDQIVEDANRQGIDSFYAVYRKLFANKDKLRPYWNMARKLIYDYSVLLWEIRNATGLDEGRLHPAGGVTCRRKKTTESKKRKNKFPGTIYQSNGRYYWIVPKKMKNQPLIDPRSKPKIPGYFIINNGRYYWYVPKWIKRQRLVPKDRKYSTKDKDTALKIARRKWSRIRKDDPELAANIIRHTRFNGVATNDRDVAEKVAAGLWRKIQKEDPELAAKILQDNRPKGKDHWHAQIVVNGKHRFLGSFDTKAKAQAVYAEAFEEAWGYPPGYNVSSIPKIDKVWPTWQEEKTRLKWMSEYPRMPVIGKSAEPLEPMIKRMRKVDWLVKNCIVVLDDNSPVASREVAIQSRGKKWYAEIKKQGKRPVIQGSTSIDKDTGRIRITVYGQGSSESRVLTEEVYHIIFEIIRQAGPKTFASIKKWYSYRLKKGLDPTWLIHEAFAEFMVQEAELPGSTDLPRNVANYAQRVFSNQNIVPKCAMKKVLAGV